jgi:hypothetical protein
MLGVLQPGGLVKERIYILGVLQPGKLVSLTDCDVSMSFSWRALSSKNNI